MHVANLGGVVKISLVNRHQYAKFIYIGPNPIDARKPQEVKMPKKGTKNAYKAKIEYRYTVKDVAEAAGMTRNALGVAKAQGKVDPGDFKSMVSFLTRRIIEKRLEGNLFAPKGRGARRRGRTGSQVFGRRAKKAIRRR
jgi:hypothetical protein